ncbi:MAG TPA: carbohydrate kinase, partial [Actinomycetota bacterium]|nr:carbohydrate kinase [Actinomycetota bacterium]
MDDLLLGLDLGTTRCKAVLVSTAGAEVASAAAPTPFEAAGGGIEMAVPDLLATVSALCRSLPAGAGRVAGAGIASMAECG